MVFEVKYAPCESVGTDSLLQPLLAIRGTAAVGWREFSTAHRSFLHVCNIYNICKKKNGAV